jgi:hypothetical protein
MKCKLRNLGVALVGVLVMSGAVASAASAANDFTTGSDNTTLTGSGGAQAFVTEGNAEIYCTSATTNVTGVGTVTSEITAVLSYAGCTLTEGGTTMEAQIDMNGCAYVFTAGGPVHIECPGGKTIKLTAKIAGVFQDCFDIHPQTPTSANVDYIDGTNSGTGKSKVEIESTIEGITYERTGSCKKAEEALNETNSAEYIGGMTVTGDKSTGEPVDVAESAVATTTLTAKALNTQRLILAGAELKCTAMSLNGAAQEAEGRELVGEPEYGGCTFVEGGSPLEGKVDVNGCQYRFTETGEADIECPAEQAIKITVFVGGVFKECLDVRPQTPTNANVDFRNATNAGTGKMDFEIESTIEGITYERTGACKLEKEGENEGDSGSYVGSITITGDNEEGNATNVTQAVELLSLTAVGAEQKFVTGGGTEIKCTGVTSSVGEAEANQAEITLEPSYTGCTFTEFGITREAAIDVNGCAYLLTDDGSAHIECPGAKVIKITAKIAGALRECIDIQEQTPTTADADYRNSTDAGTGRMDFEVESTIEGITYERTGLCKKSEAQLNETDSAKYIGSLTLTGDDQEGNPVDVTK